MSKKEVIYIDSDDDITSIIEKASSSESKIIALVLPKRFSTLKSSVNMKLLKKTADADSKKLVLITDDSSLLPLAGSAGIHVAENLKSPPSVPKFALPSKDDMNVIDDTDPELDAEVAIGELEKNPSAKKETEEVDQPTDASEIETVTVAGAKSKTKTKSKTSDKSAKIREIKGKSKIKVPNFNAFRVRMGLLGLFVVLLIGGWFFAFKIAPQASVTIQAQTSRVPTSIEAVVEPGRTTSVLDKKVLASEVQEVTKTVTERFQATGEKDVGKKATGTISIENCDTNEEITLSAGTTFTDENGNQFESTTASVVSGASFSVVGGEAQCQTPGSGSADVIAEESGDDQNLSPRNYSVSGVSALITGSGGAMTGGTSEVVDVVSEEDISNARQALANKTDENVKAELTAKFKDSLVIEDSFDSSAASAVLSVKAGDEAEEGTISSKVTYSLIGIKTSVVEDLLEQEQNAKIDSDSLSILDNGIDDLKLTLDKTQENGKLLVTIKTDGFAGPEIDTNALAETIEGMGFSEAIEYMKDLPGVREVDLELGPFWVFSVPNPDKTAINVEISAGPLQ